MNKLYIGDNLDAVADLKKSGEIFDIVYLDPPYNTGNVFGYNDKKDKKSWYDLIESRVRAVKPLMGKESVLIFSISEESLFDSMKILKDNFKNLFEPIVWLTKNDLNQNKTTNISAVCHEYVLIASDYKIKTNSELLPSESSEKKQANYPLSIILEKDISDYETVVINGKSVKRIPKGTFSLEKGVEGSFAGHKFQKRTCQKGHGSERYVKMVKGDTDYSNDTLYFIEGVKDKQGLGGKFILGNAYFQSISSVVQVKMPSFLGYYQPGIKGFQTAKPIPLMERLFRNFSKRKDSKILDLYSGSGNVIIAANNLNLGFVGCEFGLEKESENEKGKFISERLKKEGITFEKRAS